MEKASRAPVLEVFIPNGLPRFSELLNSACPGSHFIDLRQPGSLSQIANVSNRRFIAVRPCSIAGP